MCWGHISLTIFSITIQIRWKIHFAVNPLLVIMMQQTFAHAMTAVLTWHVQNFVVIAKVEFGRE